MDGGYWVVMGTQIKNAHIWDSNNAEGDLHPIDKAALHNKPFLSTWELGAGVSILIYN